MAEVQEGKRADWDHVRRFEEVVRAHGEASICRS